MAGVGLALSAAAQASNAASARSAASATQANLDRQLEFDKSIFDRKQTSVRENNDLLHAFTRQQQDLANTSTLDFINGSAGITSQQQAIQQQAIQAQQDLLKQITENRIAATTATTGAYDTIGNALTDRSNAWDVENTARTNALSTRGAAVNGIIGDRTNAVSEGTAARASAQDRIAAIFQREAARENATMNTQSDITNGMIDKTSYASTEAARTAAASGASLAAQAAIAGSGGADASVRSDLVARDMAAKEAAARARVGQSADARASLFGYTAANAGVGDALSSARTQSAMEAARYATGSDPVQYETKLAQTDFDNAGAMTQGRLALSDQDLRVADAGLKSAFGLSADNMHIADAALAKTGGMGLFDLNQAKATQSGQNTLAQGGLQTTLGNLKLDNAKLSDALDRLKLNTEATVTPTNNYLNANIGARQDYIAGLTGATDAYHQGVTASNNFVLQNIRPNNSIGNALSMAGSAASALSSMNWGQMGNSLSQGWNNMWRPSQNLEGGFLNTGNGMYGRV